MNRKAQVINIDWSIGLGLLILTLVSSIIIMAEYQPFDPETSLKNDAREVQTNIIDETSIDGYKNSLIVKSPVKIQNIPIDKDFNFPDNIKSGSGYINSGILNITDREVIAVKNLENRTDKFVYFDENTSERRYNDDIQTGSWMNNSKISVKPESPGIQSLKVGDREILNGSADLNGNSFSTTDNGFYAESLSGDLKIYNNSREIIIENGTDLNFELKNLSTLYWRSDNSTEELEGTGTFKSGDTAGFSIASDYGITFVGDMTATVSKPDNYTVEADIDTDRLRIFLHDSDYKLGRKRIKTHEQGHILISGREEISGPTKNKLKQLENLSKDDFEQRLNLEDFNYNITVEDGKEELFNRGNSIPFQDAVTSDLSVTGLNYTGERESFNSRVTVWR